MICKERSAKEHPSCSDPAALAGMKAERQLAFYLQRAFGQRRDIAVFNDLRLVAGNEVAQIDHLVLHPWGIIVIESKSITGTIHINERGEWTRVTARGEQGMPDAVQQARLQREVLVGLLKQNARRLRPMVSAGFAGLGFDVLAAISDNGVIKRQRPAEKVRKADQITQAVLEIIARRKDMLEKSGAGAGLAPAEMSAIIDFLQAAHSPRVKPAPAPRRASALVGVPAGAARAAPAGAPSRVGPAVTVVIPEPATKPQKLRTPAHHCPRCGGGQLEMSWCERPRGYCFCCPRCRNLWKPDYTCPGCGKRNVFPRQTRGTYLQECKCGMSRVFHRNA